MAEKRSYQQNQQSSGPGAIKRASHNSVTTLTGPTNQNSVAPSILALQQLVGNKAVQRHLDGTVQAKEEDAPAPVADAIDLDLNDRPTLFPGMSGPYVGLLQNKLRAAAFNDGGEPISGQFDALTKTWVVEFQKAMKLKPDGIVGSLTWTALDASSRGAAISDSEEARLIGKTNEARDQYDAGQYEAALASLMAVYADPLVASKPLWAARVVWGIASCHHTLAFVDGVKEDEKRTRLREAMSWYQEYGMREGLDSTKKMNAAIRIRECRLGQKPTSYDEMEEWKQEMN